SPDGKHLISTSGKNLRVWDAETGISKRVVEDFPNIISDVIFSSDGRVMIVATGERYNHDNIDQIRLYDIETGRLLFQVPERTSDFFDLMLSPDGATFLAVSDNFLLWYGIPTSKRPATPALIGRANAAFINLRSEPSLNGEIVGQVAGNILITGRDETG